METGDDDEESEREGKSIQVGILKRAVVLLWLYTANPRRTGDAGGWQ